MLVVNLDATRAAFSKVLLFTGLRGDEVANARWTEIDLAKALWTIPAARMKNGSEHLVPLSPPVVKILKSLPRRGEFAFTGNGRTPIGDFSSMKTRLNAVLPPEMPAWCFHDLRRTVRTGLSMLGTPDIVSELVSRTHNLSSRFASGKCDKIKI